jgi:hypothetical protein
MRRLIRAVLYLAAARTLLAADSPAQRRMPEMPGLLVIDGRWVRTERACHAD